MNISNINLQLIKELLSMKAPTEVGGAGLVGKAGESQGLKPGDAQALKPGDVVQAKVVAASNESIILNIGGTRIPASTELALSPGQTVALIVAEMTPECVVLKQVPDKSRGALPAKYTKDDLVNYLLKDFGLKGSDIKEIANLLKGGSIETGQELKQLKSLLSSLFDADGGLAGKLLGEDLGAAGKLLGGAEVAGKESGAAGPRGLGLRELSAEIDKLIVRPEDKQQVLSRVKAMVEALSHEAKLVEFLDGADVKIEDLKEALLRARVQVGDRQEISPELKSQVKEAAEKIITIFNAVGALNLPVESTARDFYYLPIPVQVGEHVATAEIKIYNRDSNGGAPRTGASIFTIGFSLDMPSLGKTRALVEVVDKFINFSIGVENAAALDGADALFDDLKISLEGLGYEVGRVSAVEIREVADEAGLEPRSLIEEKLGVKQEGIDVKA